MSGFDDILKKGKEAVDGGDPKEDWRNYINSIMHEIHQLNATYGDNIDHHIVIEHSSCSKCSEATFIMVVRDFDDRAAMIKFHRGDWVSVGNNKYLCKNCKG